MRAADLEWRLLARPDLELLVEWEKERPYPWKPESFLETIGSNLTKTLVFLQTEKVVGFAVVQVIGDEGYLQNVSVAPALRRKGVGEKILQKVMMWALKQGARLLTLDVDPQNKAAVGLYQKLGFEILEVRKKSYPRGEDALVMRKKL